MCKLSIAGVEQERGVVVVGIVGRDQVELAVVVKVGEQQAVRVRVLAVFGPEGRALSRRETAPTVTEEDGNTIAVVIGRYGVGVSVAVDISNGNFRRALA